MPAPSPAASPLRAALAVAALAWAGVAAAEPPWRPIALSALDERLDTQVPHTLTAAGIEIPVDGNANLALPLAAQALELELEANGPVLLTWASRSRTQPFRPFGPPWRHLTIPRERTRVLLDLRITDAWVPGSQAILGFTGTGRVLLHAARALPLERTSAATLEAYDRAVRWAPEAIGHTTINFLEPAYWSASRKWMVPDVAAAAGAAAFAAVAGLSLLRRRRDGRRRPRLALALAAAALVATAVSDVHLLARFVPAFRLELPPDVETRIRDHYDIAPDVGALAALARATLGPTERVGALAAPGNWFAPQTLCFNLAPRPCVLLTAGSKETVHSGIMGVGRLRDDELDAVVADRAGDLPKDFVPVAALGSSAVVARRRR